MAHQPTDGTPYSIHGIPRREHRLSNVLPVEDAGRAALHAVVASGSVRAPIRLQPSETCMGGVRLARSPSDSRPISSGVVNNTTVRRLQSLRRRAPSRAG